MPGGRTKTKISIAIDPVIARVLEARAKAKGVSRSAAVEEALSVWLRRLIEEEHGVLDRLEENGRLSGPRGDAEEARIAAGMVLAAMRYQFRALEELDDEELRRRAVAAQQRRGR